MKKLALIAALSVVGIANAQAADGTITINGLVTDKTCDIVTPVLVYMVKPMLTVHSVLDSAQLIYQWLLDELLFDQVILLERF